MEIIAVIWGKWGPYHFARFNALVRAVGPDQCIGVALAGESVNYAWEAVDPSTGLGNVFVLNPGKAQETLSPLQTGKQVYKLLRSERVTVAFLPGYWPARSLAVLLSARLAGVRCVMMNESHAGTEQARGVQRWVKRQLLRLFHAGLVGGTPHVQHFRALGMREDKLFTGYDTVDNDLFAETVRGLEGREAYFRTQLGLPRRYILNLSRMVPKKNLSVLIEAYAGLNIRTTSLVLVGSGPGEQLLRALAVQRGLLVRDLKPGTVPADTGRTVFFAGFRQIAENPLFYGLAEVFVLPSISEEWGLVVNEAMACGLPVLVSNTVGSARDLVRDGVNGAVFNPCDSHELATLLTRVLCDPELRKDWGLRSRELICNWGCERFAQGALHAAHAALSKSGNPAPFIL